MKTDVHLQQEDARHVLSTIKHSLPEIVEYIQTRRNLLIQIGYPRQNLEYILLQKMALDTYI